MKASVIRPAASHDDERITRTRSLDRRRTSSGTPITSFLPRTELSKSYTSDIHSSTRRNRNESLLTVPIVSLNNIRNVAILSIYRHNTIYATGEVSVTLHNFVRWCLWGYRVRLRQEIKHVARARPPSTEYIERANKRRGRSHCHGRAWRHAPRPAPVAPSPRRAAVAQKVKSPAT